MFLLGYGLDLLVNFGHRRLNFFYIFGSFGLLLMLLIGAMLLEMAAGLDLLHIGDVTKYFLRLVNFVCLDAHRHVTWIELL